MDYERMNHEERQMLRDVQAFRFRTRYAYRIPEGNDYQTMLVMTEQREQGLKPSTRHRGDLRRRTPVHQGPHRARAGS